MSECWCDRVRASGGQTCEPCQIRTLRAELEQVTAERESPEGRAV